MLLMMLANAADIGRLASLEATGKLPVGFTANALMSSSRYLARIVRLCATSGSRPQPSVEEN